MLSSRYHAFPWAAATVAVASYRGMNFVFGRSVETYSQMLLLPLLLHSMYIIWKGPPTRPQPQVNRAANLIGTCILLMSLGSVSDLVHTGDRTLPGFGCFVHACLSFVALGTRQSVEEDRDDIDPASVVLILQGPRAKLARLKWRRFGQHLLACAALQLLFYLEVCFVNLALSTIYGSAMSCQSIWAENFSNVRHHLGSCFILLYVAGALVDISETVFFIACRKILPCAVPAPEPLTCSGWGYSICAAQSVGATFIMAAYLAAELKSRSQ